MPPVPEDAGDLAVAVNAALAVLDEDQFSRRPAEHRLLKAEAALGGLRRGATGVALELRFVRAPSRR
jgi:hypothetical protein